MMANMPPKAMLGMDPEMIANMPPPRWAVWAQDDGKYASEAMGDECRLMAAMPPLVPKYEILR